MKRKLKERVRLLEVHLKQLDDSFTSLEEEYLIERVDDLDAMVSDLREGQTKMNLDLEEVSRRKWELHQSTAERITDVELSANNRIAHVDLTVTKGNEDQVRQLAIIENRLHKAEVHVLSLSRHICAVEEKLADETHKVASRVSMLEGELFLMRKLVGQAADPRTNDTTPGYEPRPNLGSPTPPCSHVSELDCTDDCDKLNGIGKEKEKGWRCPHCRRGVPMRLKGTHACAAGKRPREVKRSKKRMRPPTTYVG